MYDIPNDQLMELIIYLDGKSINYRNGIQIEAALLNYWIDLVHVTLDFKFINLFKRAI